MEMTLQDIIQQLDLSVFTTPKKFAPSIRQRICSGPLDCVMAGAKSGAIWVTLQAHIKHCGRGCPSGSMRSHH